VENRPNDKGLPPRKVLDLLTPILIHRTPMVMLTAMVEGMAVEMDMEVSVATAGAGKDVRSPITP
jgi:hypothetical protein